MEVSFQGPRPRDKGNQASPAHHWPKCRSNMPKATGAPSVVVLLLRDHGPFPTVSRGFYCHLPRQRVHMGFGTWKGLTFCSHAVSLLSTRLSCRMSRNRPQRPPASSEDRPEDGGPPDRNTKFVGSSNSVLEKLHQNTHTTLGTLVG